MTGATMVPPMFKVQVVLEMDHGALVNQTQAVTVSSACISMQHQLEVAGMISVAAHRTLSSVECLSAKEL